MRTAQRLAGCALVFLLTACPSSDPPAPPSGAEPDASVVPGRGKVRFGVLGEPATLDPYSERATDLTRALVAPLYPSLFRLLPDGSAVPYLVDEITGDGNMVRLSLRAMAWSDGTPIDARDVVATWRRARPPSGLALARQARVVGEDVVLEGEVERWELALAIASPILPGGRAGEGVYGGPFALTERVPGLKLVLEPQPEWSGLAPGLARVEVDFIDSLNIMLALLEDGRLDAAGIPSTVNLGERLSELDLDYDRRLGWETIRLGFHSSLLGPSVRRALLHTANLPALAEGLIRDDGRLAPGLVEGGAGAGLPSPITLAVPEGDELTFLLQRAFEIELAEAGTAMDLLEIDIRTFYAGEMPEAEVWLERAAGFPLRRKVDPRSRLSSLPLFEVKTYLAWRPGLRGLQVNPSVAGPLWNLEEWSKT